MAGFGDVLELGAATKVVVGRPMNMEKLEADVAAVLLHRAGETLFIVDTGATEDFRGHLRSAIEGMGSFSRVVLVNSHGHSDHVGCNGVIDELEVAQREHYISRSDLGLLHDNEAYFARAFGAAAEHLPMPFPPEQMAEGMLQMFGTLDTREQQVRALESLPLEQLGAADVVWPGWRFGDDDVYVLMSGGHTAGETIVYLPKQKLVYGADETTGFYPVWPDSDPLKAFHTLSKLRELIAAGAVESFADGHHFEALDRDGADDFIGTLVDSYVEFDHVVHDALADGGATVFEIRDQVAKMYEKHALHGESENKLFGGMMVLKKLEEVGAVSEGDDPKQATFRLPGGAE